MIVTERLKIVPLTYIELQEYIKRRNWHIKTDEDESKIQEFTIKLMSEAPISEHLFYTFWKGFHKREHILDIGLLRPPNQYNVVEVWYHVNEFYWGKGFATEALTGFVWWINSLSGIDYVGASVDPKNEASKRVLIKSGFEYACTQEDVEIYFANLKK